MTSALSETILDSMPLGLVAIDNTMTIIRYNEAAANIMGLPVEHVLGRNIDDVFRPRANERTIQLTLERQIEFRNYEVQIEVCGQMQWLLINTWLMRGDHGEVLGATMAFSDITAVKEMEQHLVRSARLVTIGEMAAGAAHEIRNPLTVIKGFLQLWERDHQHPYLPLILREVDHIDKIVQQFLQLSKKDLQHTDGQKEFDLLETIRDLNGLCDSEAILNGIEFTLHHEADPIPVLLNRTEWKQIVVNLIRNAFDAFTEAHPNKQVQVHLRRRRDHAALFIVDNGSGMSKQLLRQVRDAFFTTKENGTGLGLAICESLAARNGCRFRMYSREGRGTVVVLQVPLR
ncbi:hypothetical protein CBW65_13150 [Tumebacillus avium]|uniref:histidine kinase n=1 Tax=Tumebacillus avium TaxID=1903704 RepID=A0A1Y0IMS3_9BACL|nr:ATP-binding protein [Tumebacillus avium]ARU61872.1 hypothetical protein CBW65_13150 [Tumebacillus avium]